MDGLPVIRALGARIGTASLDPSGSTKKMKPFYKSSTGVVVFTSVLVVLTVPALTGLAASLDELNALARSGRTQDDAPVKAEVYMRIAASPAVVWALLINASSWPKVERSDSEGRGFTAPGSK